MRHRLFKLFFKKRLEEYKFNTKQLNRRIEKLNSENNILKEQLLFEKRRFKRIKFLLNNRITDNNIYLIEKTKKDLNVLTKINKCKYKIEIFDLDNMNYNADRTLVLFARIIDEDFFIDDIQGGKGNGHGELAMTHLIDFAQKLGLKTIRGKLSYVDYSHGDRLKAFYKKMEFSINYKPDGNGSIIRSL